MDGAGDRAEGARQPPRQGRGKHRLLVRPPGIRLGDARKTRRAVPQAEGKADGRGLSGHPSLSLRGAQRRSNLGPWARDCFASLAMMLALQTDGVAFLTEIE